MIRAKQIDFPGGAVASVRYQVGGPSDSFRLFGDLADGDAFVDHMKEVKRAMTTGQKAGAPYVSIEVKNWKYRFFGEGRWQIFFANDWRYINAKLVHVEALAIAAEQCIASGEAVKADFTPGEAPGGGVTVGMPAVQGTGQDEP